MASILANNIIGSSSEISFLYNDTEEIFGYEIKATILTESEPTKAPSEKSTLSNRR